MKKAGSWGLFIILFAMVSGPLSCTGSTSSEQKDYDWSIRFGYLDSNEPPFVYQGAFSNVPVYLDSMPDVDIDSLTILIAYDPKALTFILAEPGEMISEWSEFTFSEQTYQPEDVDTALELVKIVAARTSSEENKKAVELSGQELFSMQFYVTDDRNYECMYTPVNFFWLECGDNAIYYNSGESMAYSENVYTINWVDPNIPWHPLLPEDGTIDDDDHFYGAFDDCRNGDAQKIHSTEPSVDFYNGGLEILCANSIDYTVGDINLNEIAYEIGDAVLFANYFIFGDTVFAIDKNKQILASDVNHDHEYLTLADLDYIIRVITGDAIPTSHLQHNQDTVSLAFVGDTLSVSSAIDLGAAYFVFNGDVNFELLTTEFESKSDFASGKTRILLYSWDNAKFTSGITQILKSSDLQALDSGVFSGYYGNSVVTRMPE